MIVRIQEKDYERSKAHQAERIVCTIDEKQDVEIRHDGDRLIVKIHSRENVEVSPRAAGIWLEVK